MIPIPTPEELLVRGWNIIPVRLNKKPAIPSWKEFQRRRVSVAEVHDWERKYKPRAWAVITGAISGLIVLDFDGNAGNATLRRLELNPHVRTGTGGHHVYVEHPGFRVSTLNAKSKGELEQLYPGLDIRGDGGYVIAAGRNEVGEYQWLRKRDPDPFINLPAELQDFLKPSNEEPAVKRPKTSKGRVSAERLVSKALQRAPTGRNDSGLWLAMQLRDNGYSQLEAEQVMRDYVTRAPNTNTKGHPAPYTEQEAFATLRQAYSRPPRQPWTQSNTREEGKEDFEDREGFEDEVSEQFEVTNSGVFCTRFGHKLRKSRTRICSRLDVLKQTRDDRGEGWGRLLRWRDREDREHIWSMPMSLLAGSGEEYRARLLDGGLEIEPGGKARELLTTYIQTAGCDEQARCVSKLGWHGDVFVLPDTAIGASADQDQFIYQSAVEADHHFRVHGSCEDWKREIGSLCSGNSRLTFAVCLAFAAPLLLPSETESGGFHIWGPSSLGKSTALMVAGSVCGGGGRNGYVESWRTTANALEAFAELHNDCLACLDEISQVNAPDAVEALYMLANGQGKGRMSKAISLRRRLSWTILILSSGEITLREHAETARKHSRAGSEIRLANIPADAGASMGLFENLHCFPTAAAFAGHLKEVAKKYYGSPIREFLKRVAEDRPGVDEGIRTSIERFVGDEILSGSSAEVLRVARRFALAAAAGEIATGFGLTGWRNGEATRAIDRCLKAWLAARGSMGPSDIDAGISQVRAFIEAHGASRFQSSEHTEEKVIDRAGFLKRGDGGKVTHYFFLPEKFREVCAGFQHEVIAKALLERGLLDTDGKGRLQKKPRIAEFGTSVRVYAINAAILSGFTGDKGDSGDTST
jgi:uncharacterized protein (DUF927 family)